ncbi:WD40 repeat-like protein, partial [Testicularia cyperi]
NNGMGANQAAGLGVGMNSGQMPGGMANGLQSQDANGSVPEYSLAGILHFLQSEWRRYEKDRNEWEIERAEMRARIALLEGERRGVDNLKTDLMRRVKMLEYALRQERSKYLSSASNTSTSPHAAVPPHAKNPLLQGLEKGISGSGRSSPAPLSESGHLSAGTTAGTGSTLSMNPGTVNSALMGTGTFNAANLGAQLSRSSSSAKDPKSRAKSREYLKQCLQEISYLTSATTLNPLPDRGIVSGSSMTGGNAMSNSLRPRKTMIDNVPPTLPRQTDAQQGLAAGSMGRGSGSAVGGLSVPNPGPTNKTGRPGRSPLFASDQVVEEGNETEETAQTSSSSTSSEAQEEVERSFPNPLSATFVDPNSLESSSTSDTAEEFGSKASGSETLSSSRSSESAASHALSSPGGYTDNETDDTEQVTAIFKPGGRDWQKLKEAGLRNRERRGEEARGKTEDEAAILSEAQQQLALTSEKVNQLMHRSGRGNAPGAQPDRRDEEDLANLSLAAEDEDAAKEAADAAADSLLWKSKRVLRSHLDAVRAVAFTQNELCLLSASDDNTVKFWNLDLHALNSQNSAKSGTDSQPLVTFRGHSAGVTSIAVSPSKRCFYSGSLDSSIRVWQLPDKNTSVYPPFEKTMQIGTLVGHTQAVWDLALLPNRSDDEGLLASASADGTVKIWAVHPGAGTGGNESAPANLQLSWDYFGCDPAAETAKERENLEKSGMLPVPTSVGACHSDLRLIAVSYSNSVVKLFDLESGRQTMQLKSDETFDGTPGTQINKIVTHPTLPSLISAHEDGYIRMFDLDTGACTLSMVAHLDAVTSLDIDASGLTLVSGGHDCSVRFWDIAGGSLSSRESGPGDSIALSAAGIGKVSASGSSSTTAVCRQEITAHRKKAGEGVLAVKYHPTAPFFASAGADGVIRIYG